MAINHYGSDHREGDQNCQCDECKFERAGQVGSEEWMQNTEVEDLTQYMTTSRWHKCRDCNGEGVGCSDCMGTGLVWIRDTLLH